VEHRAEGHFTRPGPGNRATCRVDHEAGGHRTGHGRESNLACFFTLRRLRRLASSLAPLPPTTEKNAESSVWPPTRRHRPRGLGLLGWNSWAGYSSSLCLWAVLLGSIGPLEWYSTSLANSLSGLKNLRFRISRFPPLFTPSIQFETEWCSMETEKTCLPRDHVFKGFLSSILVNRESNNALIKIFLVFIQIKKKKIIAGRGEQSMDSLLAGTQRCK
jgi:hypothetical protein